MDACRWRIRSQAAIGSSNRPRQCCCQIGRIPEEDAIQILAPDRADKTLNQAIDESEIGRPLPGAIADEQLVLEEQGLGGDGADMLALLLCSRFRQPRRST